MSFIDKTRNSLSDVGKIMNPAFITYGFIGITTVILGYYTFFENNIEEPVQETLPQEPSFMPQEPSFMPQEPSFMPQEPSFMPQEPQPQPQPQQIYGGTKTNKKKIKKTKKRKN